MTQADGSKQGGSSFLSQQRVGSVILIVLLLASLIGVFFIIRPYLHGIILGVLFASLCRPIYRFVSARVKRRANVAAALTCILVALLVMVPLASFTSILVVKGHQSIVQVTNWVQAGNLSQELREFGFEVEPEETEPAPEGTAPPSDPVLPEETPPTEPEAAADAAAADSDSAAADAVAAANGEPVTWKRKTGLLIRRVQEKLFPNFDPAQLQDQIVEKSKGVVALLAPEAWSLVQKGMGLVVNFVIMLFVMFYVFRDGPKILDYLLELSPLGRKNERLLIDRVVGVTRSAVMGTGLTAVAQGVLGMIGFVFAGIPWFFWGVVLGLASLIPIVGTALVWIPCCVYLLITGKTVAAIGLAVYCIVVVGMSDNFLRPMLMRGETGMSPLIAFFAILGGIQFFGLIGVIYGPLIFGICAILLYIFKLETHENQTAEQRKKPDRRTPEPDKPRPEPDMPRPEPDTPRPEGA